MECGGCDCGCSAVGAVGEGEEGRVIPHWGEAAFVLLFLLSVP